MKKITELTEEQINVLTNEEIHLMIKLKKAEEGVKFLECPESPKYHSIPEPEMTVYSCEFFGDKLAVSTIDELNALIDLLKTFGKYKIDYNYNKSESDQKYATSELDKPYHGDWSTPKINKVYSKETYDKIVSLLAENKAMKAKYEKEYGEYKKYIDSSKWIADEIYERVNEVKTKFRELNEYCRRFKVDYLPLANDNTEIALKFLEKAYNLTTQQLLYVSENYAKS